MGHPWSQGKPLAQVRAPNNPLPRRMDARAAPARMPSSDRQTHDMVGVRTACLTRKGFTPRCSIALSSADPAGPSRSPRARPTAAACADALWPTTACIAARTAAPPTLRSTRPPAPQAAPSAGSAARSCSGQRRPAAAPSSGPRRGPRPARGVPPVQPRAWTLVRPAPSGATWTAVVDGSWISRPPSAKVVDRSPCAGGARRAIIWSARRGRGIRIAGPPQGGRAHRKVGRVLRKGRRPSRKGGMRSTG